MSKHTPGPWTVSLWRYTSQERDGYGVLPNLPIYSIESSRGMVSSWPGINELKFDSMRELISEHAANAALVAAAPELLKAAKCALRLLNYAADDRNALGPGGLSPRDSDAFDALTRAIRAAESPIENASDDEITCRTCRKVPVKDETDKCLECQIGEAEYREER